MTLNSSGKISLGGSTAGQSFEYEVGSGTYPGYNQPISLNDSRVRQLTGNPTSGTTNSMNSLHGKSWRISVSRTYASSTLDPAVISTSTFSNYLAGYTDVTITVNSGVYLYTSVPSNYSLYLSDFTSGDTLTIVNNGYIVGRGGIGGGQNGGSFIGNGKSGGPGIGIGHNLPTTLINNGYIAGGGGGGGGYTSGPYAVPGGGGAGGGAGGGSAASGTYVAGGAGGSLGGSGANGTYQYFGCCAIGSGGGGGYILPGSGGNSVYGSQGGGAGGQGGSWLIAGGAGGSGNGVGGSVSGAAGGGGGGWGASGGNSLYTSGGGGYPAISSYSTITISGSGTIYGAVNHA